MSLLLTKKKTVFRRQTKTQTYISEYGYINIKIDKMEVKRLDIVYATDNNFIDVLYASIASLYDTNGDLNLDIWIIGEKISDLNKDKINNLSKEYNQKEVNWIENCEVPYQVKLDRGSASQYSRLMIGSILPDSIKKALYLDADTIILSNLVELFNVCFENKIVIGVSDVINAEYKKILNIPEDKAVFNTGVLLIDLEKWRIEQIESKLFDVICKFKGNVIQGDVGILNAVLYDSYKEINPKFNYMTIFEDMAYEDMLVFKKPVNYYSKKEIEDARNNIVIRHYTTCFLSKRPWQHGSKVAHLEEFKKYYKGDSKVVKESQVKKIYDKLPHKLGIRLVGFIQSEIRPRVYKIFK